MGKPSIPLPGGGRIPLEEIRLRFSRSAGPGGQHVNRTESRVELEWDVGASAGLAPDQKTRLLSALPGRIDARGVLHIACQETRSQHRNRAMALDRLQALAAAALRVRRARRPSRPSASARERRLREKARRARLKSQRRRAADE